MITEASKRAIEGLVKKLVSDMHTSVLQDYKVGDETDNRRDGKFSRAIDECVTYLVGEILDKYDMSVSDLEGHSAYARESTSSPTVDKLLS